MENDIDKMKQIKHILEYCTFKNSEHKDILNATNDFLLKYCVHKIVKDSIDIDLDRSKTIYYCEKCELTFNEPICIKKSTSNDSLSSEEWLEWYYDSDERSKST